MLKGMKSFSPSGNKMQLTVIFITYFLCALIFGIAYRFKLNPDGISELRLAGYIAEGHFQQSVSAGYSPLNTWLIYPFILFGFDGLTAARLEIALCGAGLLFCSWLLAQRFDLPQNIRFIAVLTAAPLISFWTIQFISPDVLFAALTLCYLYLVTDPDILDKRKISFLCGIAGGFSYLAHHYALPFFLVHFPAMLLTRGYTDKAKEGFPWKKVLISWGMGITVLLIVASVWIGIVSSKYGHLIISPKGGIAHAIMGPQDKDRRHPFFVGGLFKPRDAYAIHIFEDPSDVKFESWSPFESKEYFMHQLKIIKDNAVYILNHFVNKSPFFTYAFVIGVLAFIPIAFLLNPLNNKKKFLYAWGMITFSFYSSGFLLLIARSPRRFYALMLIFLLLSFHFMEELKYAVKDIVPGRRKKLLAFYLLIMIIATFALKPSIHFMKSIKHISTVDSVNPYREMAEQIKSIEFPSPYAIIRSSQKPTTDYYMAYFIKKQFLGRPLSTDVQGITKELETSGGKSVLIFDTPDIVEKLKLDKKYVFKASLKLNRSNRYENAVNWVVLKDEIIKGWDNEVSIFTLNQ
jgi:hypothetical protein